MKHLLHMETRFIDGHWIQLIDTHFFPLCFNMVPKFLLKKTHKSSGAQNKVWNYCTFCTAYTFVHFGQRDTRCLTFFADAYLSDSLCAVQCEFLALWNSFLVLWFASLHEKTYNLMRISSITYSGVTKWTGKRFLFPFHMFVINVQTQPLNWSRRNDGGDGLDVRDKGATHCMSRMGFCNERKVELLFLQ